ncbi:hypothetical protein TWF481_001481 [Arthrobotrys musiformis]|uniref:BTB domain-containing protein n=1 Tax=Arthrobotrys musiformis TaxID=47236 RepID=A0AAV9WRS4_9PEZI
MRPGYSFQESPRYTECLPDVTLVVGFGPTTVKVHKSLLQSHSEFFNSIFSERGGPRETRPGEISIVEVHWLGMEAALDWMYTGVLWEPKDWALIDRDDAKKFVAIFVVINFCQLWGLKNAYEKFFERRFSSLTRAPLTPYEKGGRWVGFVIHEFYRVGGAVEKYELAWLINNLRDFNTGSQDPQGDGYLGFRRFVDGIDDPDTRFLHDLCRAYGACF